MSMDNTSFIKKEKEILKLRILLNLFDALEVFTIP